MLTVCVVQRQGEFNVARELEAAGASGPVDQSDPPNLNVVFRRNNHLGFGLNTVIGAPEHGPVKRKVGGIPLNLPADWVIGVGPQAARIDILDVAEGSPRITGSI